jgi:hypothetical protein
MNQCLGITAITLTDIPFLGWADFFVGLFFAIEGSLLRIMVGCSKMFREVADREFDCILTQLLASAHLLNA